jgi:hypothetical protein
MKLVRAQKVLSDPDLVEALSEWGYGSFSIMELPELLAWLKECYPQKSEVIRKLTAGKLWAIINSIKNK